MVHQYVQLASRAVFQMRLRVSWFSVSQFFDPPGLQLYRININKTNGGKPVICKNPGLAFAKIQVIPKSYSQWLTLCFSCWFWNPQNYPQKLGGCE